jgi:hypothetical protein
MLEIKSSYNRREAAVAATVIVTTPTYYTLFDGRPVEALPGPAKLYTVHTVDSLFLDDCIIGAH